jgi:hypothetical protein
MKFRLFLGFVCILLSPLFANIDGSPRNGATVYAGHLVSGGWCECGCPSCICDPGEQIEMCIPGAKGEPQSEGLGDEALLLGAALLVARRIFRKSLNAS